MEIKNRVIAEKGLRHWQQLCEKHQEFSQQKEPEPEIQLVLGSSEFIFRQLMQHPHWLEACRDQSLLPQHSEAYLSDLSHELADATTDEHIMRVLRQFRHFYMMRIAWRDLAGAQPIEVSLQQVSALADALILGAYNHLYALHCQQFGVPQGDHGPQPLLILAMGKLGGGELNFSSDIDLIFTYPEKGETQGGKRKVEHQQFFIRLAQKLINTLNRITDEGQVFRVDMRLRPFGESGPLVVHQAAFEDYYQEQGRHWERFAMIKARILNPPSPYTESLEAILTPFSFRRYLDFTTIDALRNMKQLIASEQRRRQLADNIKLGSGGIREVEFFAQSFQLIHGGREPALQVKSLKATLAAIEALNLINKDDIKTLYLHYLFLRKAEHTLQQINDEQTQLLPEDEWRKAVLATASGFNDYDSFHQHLICVKNFINQQFTSLIDTTDQTHDENDTLIIRCRDAWNLALKETEFRQLLSPPLSPETASEINTALNDFREQLRHYRLGQRGEDTLNKLMPEVLYVLLEEQPSGLVNVLKRVLGVINAVTGRTTYLDLLLENPDVLKQLVKLCDKSDWIAQQIQRFPLLLDELLTPLYLQQQNTNFDQSRRIYKDELRQSMLRIDPDDVELIMDNWRQFKLCQQLRIAASDISGSLPVACVSDKLTALAETLLNSVVQHAWQQMTQRFGKPEHVGDNETGFAVIGYGKLGGYELGYGSDLDLVFLNNAPRDSVTIGKKSLGASQFYIKLAQRIMHLLNTTTLFGQLYETDLRLRPSGNAGLLCCHINSFARYQREDAWTWEHQALVRARGVTGDADLLTNFETLRQSVLCQVRDIPTLNGEVKDMREKMREHLLASEQRGVDLKQCNGGITDIEFMAQFWVLAYAAEYPQLTKAPDNLRILEAVEKAGLINETSVATLQDAYLQLRDHYHQLTLADHRYADNSELLASLRKRVTEHWQALFNDG